MSKVWWLWWCSHHGAEVDPDVVFVEVAGVGLLWEVEMLCAAADVLVGSGELVGFVELDRAVVEKEETGGIEDLEASVDVGVIRVDVDELVEKLEVLEVFVVDRVVVVSTLDGPGVVDVLFTEVLNVLNVLNVVDEVSTEALDVEVDGVDEPASQVVVEEGPVGVSRIRTHPDLAVMAAGQAIVSQLTLL